MFLPLIWFEQKVRITPELAANLKIIPIVLQVGQIFAGLCFAAGLVLLCWFPLENLMHKRCTTSDLKEKSSIKKTPSSYSKEDKKEDTLSPEKSPLMMKAELFSPNLLSNNDDTAKSSVISN